MKIAGSGFSVLCLAVALMAGPVNAQTAVLVEAGLKGREFRARETQTLSMLAGFQPQGDMQFSRFGGRMDRSEQATGFFHTARVDGRWWLVDPEGHLFLSVGINSVRPAPDSDKFIEDSAAVLHENHFNTLGCWSAGREFRASPTPFPYCLHWNFMRAYRAHRKARYPGTGTAEAIYPFDPEFTTFCEEHARALAATKDDPWLVGHFIDNEMPLHENGIISRYLQFPDSDPCHQAAAAFMRKRSGKPGKEDDRAFLQSVVKTYYRTVEEACRKHDPHHMLLGSRFHGQALASPALFTGAGPHTDVISVNYYGRWGVEQQRFDDWAKLADKPILVSEWYANVASANAGWLVKTEADRGRFYQHMTLGLLENRNCVGWHWFKFAPMFLGDGRPSTELFDAAREINEQVYPLAEFFLTRGY